MSPTVPPIDERRFADGESAARYLADTVAAALRAAVAARGQASLLVSGGKSPIPFFHALSQQALPWAQVWISLADERWLPPDAADANARLVAEHLLTGPAAAARFIPLKSDAETPEAGLAVSTAALAQIPRPFDVVVLGMGEDGHTASLFPGAAGIEAALAPAGSASLVAIDPPAAPYPRISLTVPALLDTRLLLLALQGQKKEQVYREALTAPERHPIGVILRHRRSPMIVTLN